MEILYTERLILRPFTLNDRMGILEILSDEETVRFMYYRGRPGSTPESDTDDFLSGHAIPEWNKEPIRIREYAVELKKNNELIGGVSIEILDDHKAEIGWILRKDQRHMGYATEAAERLLRFGFEELDMHRIIASCDERNRPSERVMERLGMLLISRTPGARPMKSDGIAGTEIIYGIERASWWWKNRGGDSYVKKARSALGHDLLIFVGACVFVCKDGKMLLQKRRDDGKWSNHGGCVEPGEYIEDAVRRELCEETGLTAHRLFPVGVYTGPGQFHTYPNGDMAWIVDNAFLCDSFEGEIRMQESELTGLKWFGLEELPPQAEWEETIYRMLPDCLRVLREKGLQNAAEQIEKNDP